MARRLAVTDTGSSPLIKPDQNIVFKPSPVKTFPCRICARKGATDLTDGLCWVCNRLRISAWNNSDLQVQIGD